MYILKAKCSHVNGILYLVSYGKMLCTLVGKLPYKLCKLYIYIQQFLYVHRKRQHFVNGQHSGLPNCFTKFEYKIFPVNIFSGVQAGLETHRSGQTGWFQHYRDLPMQRLPHTFLCNQVPHEWTRGYSMALCNLINHLYFC